MRKIFLMVLLMLGFLRVDAGNSVSQAVMDTVIPSAVPECIVRGVGNSGDDRTDIRLDIIGSEPFIVYKVEWINCDSVRSPMDPFYLEAVPEGADGKANVWRIDLEFPFSSSFGGHDRLVMHTDKGIIQAYTSATGQYEDDMKGLMKSHDEYVAESERSRRNLRTVILTLAGFCLIAAIAAFIVIRRRLARRRMEIEELSMMIEERSERNLELREKVNALYRSRLDTLNMLCNGYFDNNDSEKMRDVFYKDVEKQILALRDNKSVEALEEIVNEYLDNTMLRLREQMPELTVGDLKFLAYIYAGFSPRAVCIFMNIKIKTFYNRRNLLKERILASDAPDKEFFVSRMNV